MRAGTPGVPSASEWLNDVLPPGCRVGIDPVSNVSKSYNECQHTFYLLFMRYV